MSLVICLQTFIKRSYYTLAVLTWEVTYPKDVSVYRPEIMINLGFLKTSSQKKGMVYTRLICPGSH